MFTSKRESATITGTLQNPFLAPLAPNHGHRSQKKKQGKKKNKEKKNIRCFLFVFATAELFILEADETAVLMLFLLPSFVSYSASPPRHSLMVLAAFISSSPAQV